MTDGARIAHDNRLVAKLWSDFHYDIGAYLVAGTGNEAKASSVGHPFAMIDVDSLEYCRRCRRPVAVFELKHASESSKIWTQTQTLGERAGLIARLVVVHTDEHDQIEGFQVYEPGWPQAPDVISKHDFAVWLMNLYRSHGEWCRPMREHLGAVDRLRSVFRKAV